MLTKPRRLMFGLKWEFYFSMSSWALPFHASLMVNPPFGDQAKMTSFAVGVLCFGITVFKD